MVPNACCHSAVNWGILACKASGQSTKAPRLIAVAHATVSTMQGFVIYEGKKRQVFIEKPLTSAKKTRKAAQESQGDVAVKVLRNTLQFC